MKKTQNSTFYQIRNIKFLWLYFINVYNCLYDQNVLKRITNDFNIKYLLKWFNFCIINSV